MPVSRSEPGTLRRSEDFRRVLSDGTRRRSGGIVVVGLAGRSGAARLGLAVSAAGGAVTRNRVKRRLRHAVRDLELQPGMDYVIIANREVAEAAYTRVRGWLGRALEEVAGA